MQKKVQSNPMNLSDDIAPRVAPYIHHAVQTHGNFLYFKLNLTTRVLICSDRENLSLICLSVKVY